MHTPIPQIELALEGRREVWRQTVQGYAEAERKAREESGEVSDAERQARLARQAQAWLRKAGERGAIELAGGGNRRS